MLREEQARQKSETTKVTGVASASRNSILQRYQLQRRAHVEQVIKAKRESTSLQHLNPRSLTIKKNPQWMKRGRGQLQWEGEVSAQDRTEIAHAGTEELLQVYIDENF